MKNKCYIGTYEFQKDWTIEILEYVLGIERKKNAEIADWHFKNYIKIVKYAYENKYWHDLKDSFNEAVIMAFDLNPSDYIKLDNNLKSKFGVSLEFFNKKTRARIKAIIKRERIKDIDEFYMVKEWIDRIADDEDSAPQVEILDKLLYDFEMSHKPTEG